MPYSLLFFFKSPSPTEISTLSLHDALPIYFARIAAAVKEIVSIIAAQRVIAGAAVQLFIARSARQRVVTSFAKKLVLDRKSTRLNSSHVAISYAVFCLKKKKKKRQTR